MMMAGVRRRGARGPRAALLLSAFVSCPSVLEAAPVDASLSSRLRQIEAAFRSGEAESLRPAFTAKGKVRADLKDVMEGPGSYGPSQLEVIFGRIFDENRTREFGFRDQDVTVTTPGVAFARARWLRKTKGGGSDTAETVTFTLRQESGDWRIHEIRSSR